MADSAGPAGPPDGVAKVPAFELPLSCFMSEKAKQVLAYRMQNPFPSVAAVSAGASIEKLRSEYDSKLYLGQLARQRALYDVTFAEQTIAGIKVDVVLPAGGVAVRNKDRVLINLRGGGFLVGSKMGGQIESVPIAALGQIKVLSLDYRQAPEHRFPAASEDVAAVYAELLTQYHPSNIGIYGISAGGFLTAQAIAWFQQLGLPMPGAIGIYSAAAGLAGFGGDSMYLAHLTAPVLARPRSAAPTASPAPATSWISPYFSGADLKDWRVSPELHPEVLAKFPSTMLAAGGRDWLFSRAINSHRQLVNAGVDAELYVWEGMWHGWNYEADIPESQEFNIAAARFFDRRLGRPNAQASL